MAEPAARRIVGGLLLELGVFAVLCGGFLVAYTSRYQSPAAAVVPHAWVAASVWLGLAAVRCLFALPSLRALHALRAVLLGGTLAMFVAYYLLVVAGLEGWGRVITWRLIATYANQFGAFAEALGYPGIAQAALAAAAGTMLLLAWIWLRRLDWQRDLARRASRPLLAFVALASIAAVSVQGYHFISAPPLAAGEPLALTLFHDRGASRMQSTSIAGTSALDAADERVRRDYRPVALARRPNVILIVGDALRADRLAVNGYARPTTPFLSRLQEAGRLQSATAMRAVCGESSCGLMGIAQSKYAHQISPGAFTLADVLRRYGYRFHMILGGDHTNFYELRAMYGQVDSYFDGSMTEDRYANDDRLVLDRVEELPTHSGTPVMLQFHLMSSHGVSTRFAHAPWQPAANYYRKLGRLGARASVSDAEATNYYDNGVLQFDGVVEALLERLAAKGYLDDAVVAITGDHGEMLGEHGLYAHGRSLMEPALRIPFVLVGYGRRPIAFVDPQALASQTDIAPTLLYELGVAIPDTWQGLPLQRPRARRFVHFAQSGKVGLYDLSASGGPWKFWTDGEPGGGFAQRLAAADPDAANAIGEVPGDLRAEWLRGTLPALSVASSRLH